MVLDNGKDGHYCSLASVYQENLSTQQMGLGESLNWKLPGNMHSCFLLHCSQIIQKLLPGSNARSDGLGSFSPTLWTTANGRHYRSNPQYLQSKVRVKYQWDFLDSRSLHLYAPLPAQLPNIRSLDFNNYFSSMAYTLPHIYLLIPFRLCKPFDIKKIMKPVKITSKRVYRWLGF